MKYTIQNNFLEISVNHCGAEICNITSKKTGLNYIWKADKNIWGSHAPVLFPIIGSLKNNCYIQDGKEYSLPRHGFIRNNENGKLIFQSETKICIQFTNDEHTITFYPFIFELTLTFELHDNLLEVSHEVKNKSKQNLFFNLGAHPGFNCPLYTNESILDYSLEFDQIETENSWNVTDDGLTNGESTLILQNTNNLQLSNTLFNNGALIFKTLKSKTVSIISKNHSNRIKVHFDDFAYLGIWAKPNAPFICIEPWNGIADSIHSNGQLSNKEQIIELEPQHKYSAKYSIEICE